MIPLVKTLIPSREALMPKLEEVIYSGYVAQGEVVDQFEKGFAGYIGNEYCISVNSGSSALHIALILAGVGPGDEVISTPVTAEPTNTVISQTGAKIVWADIDPDTGNMDPVSAESRINEKTKAIVVVDYAGIPVDVPGFKALELKYDLVVVEDAAHALGASFAGKRLGNHFDYTIFSFQAIKHMTTIDGGMLCVAKQADYERAKLVRWFGLDKSKTRAENKITIQGYKYHMNNVNAAFGLVQLEQLDEKIQCFIDNGQFFDQALKGVKGVQMMKYYPGSAPSYWLYTMKVERLQDFMKHMAAHGIAASQLHKRNDTHAIFGAKAHVLPATDAFEKEWVHIPCGWWLTNDDRQKIVETIKEGW